MGPTPSVRLTANFEANLEAIRLFLDERGAAAAFSGLIEDLFDRIVPNLERFSDLGIDFLARVPQSREGLVRLQALQARIGEGTVLRELIVGDYLILYAVRGANIYLLAIKHHLQLSFDLRGHWSH